MPKPPVPVRSPLPGMLIACSLLLGACANGASTGDAPAAPSVVVTSPILGSLVEEVVGDSAAVTVLMSPGVDPHDWEPSARDVEVVNRADLVVLNGGGLETGIDAAVSRARSRGVTVFEAAEHVPVRSGGDGGGPDPHIWTDPLAMKAVVEALAPELAALGIDVAGRAADTAARLDALHEELTATLAGVPEPDRQLVTGHDSFGYFADRYGFAVVGTIVPGLTSQGETSASDLAALRDVVERERVSAIFAEAGAPRQLVDAVSSETGAAVVELSVHTLPADGSYFTFMRENAGKIADALG